MTCEACIAADADSPEGVVAFCSEACAMEWARRAIHAEFVNALAAQAKYTMSPFTTWSPQTEFHLLIDADTTTIVE